MQIHSLTFDTAPRTPGLPGVGISIAIEDAPGRQQFRHLLRIACRVEKKVLPEGGKLAVPAAVFLVAVQAASHRPGIVNVVDERVLFDADVTDEGGHYLAAFSCELDITEGPIGAFFLHASFFEYLSNVIYVG